MTTSATWQMIVKGHRQFPELALIIGLFAASSVFALIATRILTHWLFKNQSPTTRYAATFFLLATSTVGIMAGLFALQFREYFAQWHEPVFTLGWFVQFAFTCAYAVYLFASDTLHNLVTPINVALLFVCSWLFEPRR